MIGKRLYGNVTIGKGEKGDKGDKGLDGDIKSQQIIDDINSSLDNIENELDRHITNHPSGNNNTTMLYPIKRLYMVGDTNGMSATTPVTLDITLYDEYGNVVFENKKGNFTWQGDSSLSYPKKNYSIDLKNQDGSKYYHKFFSDVNENDGYHLKAEFLDSSTRSRNISLARFILKNYKTKLPNRCCIDGFPFEMYINGEFHGLYNWNLKQHASTVYGLEKSNPNHLMYRAGGNDNGNIGDVLPCNFRALSTTNHEDVTYDWEDRHRKTNTQEDRDKLNRLISFVKDSDDLTFKNQLSNYFDVDYLMDYWIYANVFCMVDSLAKNMNILTYDGLLWYPTFYDMDSTLGISWGAGKNMYTILPNRKCPQEYGSQHSLLWEKFTRNFKNEILKSYWEKRATYLRTDKVMFEFNKYYNSIPIELIEADNKKWNGLLQAYDRNYVEGFLTKRLEYCDNEVFKQKAFYLPIENLTISNNSVMYNYVRGTRLLTTSIYTTLQVTDPDTINTVNNLGLINCSFNNRNNINSNLCCISKNEGDGSLYLGIQVKTENYKMTNNEKLEYLNDFIKTNGLKIGFKIKDELDKVLDVDKLTVTNPGWNGDNPNYSTFTINITSVVSDITKCICSNESHPMYLYNSLLTNSLNIDAFVIGEYNNSRYIQFNLPRTSVALGDNAGFRQYLKDNNIEIYYA